MIGVSPASADGNLAKPSSQPTLSIPVRFGYGMLGAALTFGIPFASVGPSFLVWPSFSELAALLLLAICALRVLGLVRVPARPALLSFHAIAYAFVVTTVTTALYSYPIVYPGWALTRFAQWTVLIVLVFFVLDSRRLEALAFGILVGAGLNAIAAVMELLGYSIRSMAISRLDLSNAGPWAPSVDEEFDVLIHGAAGLFSFSRTATGYVLGLSAALAVTLVRSRILLAAALLVLLLGIFATGSRLGFLTYLSIVVLYFLRTKKLVVQTVIIGTILLSAGVTANFLLPDWLDSTLAERLVGRGDDDYAEGAEGRWERQKRIFGLTAAELLFGAGAGNLGFALGLDREGFNFYGAHGFLFQYIASLGFIGSVLFLLATYATVQTVPLNQVRIGLLIALGLCAISDDLFFPTSSSGYLPILFFVAYRTAKGGAG